MSEGHGGRVHGRDAAGMLKEISEGGSGGSSHGFQLLPDAPSQGY